MSSMQVQSHLMHCLVIGFDFAIDPGFDFDFDFDFDFEQDFEQDFAARAAHQNDLLRQREQAQMPSRLALATLALKGAVCCYAARCLVYSFNLLKTISNQA